MRLIDADVLKLELQKYQIESLIEHSEEKNVFDVINEQPTAFDRENVVAELEEYATSQICYRYTNCPYINDENIKCENCGAMGAIDIVKRGGVE